MATLKPFPPPKLKMICSQCGGENVKRDAWAEWDKISQKWVNSQTFDEAYCEDCAGETSIEEVELEDQEDAA